MQTWNRTAKIKTIILLVVFVGNLILPAELIIPFNPLIGILIPLVFGAFVIPLITKLNNLDNKREVELPSWNDNPLVYKRPLSFFHFGAFFFIASGIGRLIGSLIFYQSLNFMGVASVSFGIGILMGIRLTLIWTQKKDKTGN